MILALYAEDPPGETMSRPKIQRTVRELALHPDKGALTLICVGDTIVGYAIIIYYWSNEYGGDIAALDEFYVKPPWRGKGIGSSFLESLAGTDTRTLKGVQVEVTPANAKAFAYYLRHGFTPVPNRHLFKAIS